MALTNMALKTKLVSCLEESSKTDGRRRTEEEEEEEEEKKRKRRSSKKVWKLLWVWILYRSHGILRLCMVNSLSPKLGF